MPKALKVTTELLEGVTAGSRGKYLCARLRETHAQAGCADVPSGTPGIVTGRMPTGCIFVFPHSVLPGEFKAFSDGHVRIVPWSRLQPYGRVG